MSESCEALREQRFKSAQKFGWIYDDTVSQKGEGYGRKAVMQLNHTNLEDFHLFIGPRGGMKTGRSYKSSACRFWDEVPTPDEATEEHGYDSE